MINLAARRNCTTHSKHYTEFGWLVVVFARFLFWRILTRTYVVPQFQSVTIQIAASPGVDLLFASFAFVKTFFILQLLRLFCFSRTCMHASVSHTDWGDSFAAAGLSNSLTQPFVSLSSVAATTCSTRTLLSRRRRRMKLNSMTIVFVTQWIPIWSSMLQKSYF